MKNIYLYGALNSSVTELYNIKKYLEDNNIQFTLLFYTDEKQFDVVLESIKTWFPGKKITNYPILVWDNEDNTRDFVSTLSQVKKLNFFTK